MRVFVYEHITGGALAGDPLPASLAREGDLMLGAVADDLTALPVLEVTTLRDARLPPVRAGWASIPCAAGAFETAFARALEASDAVWPIAPETGGALERVSQKALDAGRRLLGARPEALRIAASKRRTAEALAAAGVEVVPTCLLHGFGGGPGAWVVKPDDGVGCEGARWFEDADAVMRWRDHAGEETRNLVVQPYVAGTPMSLSLLCCDGEAALLACNVQKVRLRDGGFRYSGSLVNVADRSVAAHRALAAQIAAALPGLWGHAGVDFIGTGRGPVALEVNPRVTTSYVGLHRALGANPAALALALPDLGPARRLGPGRTVDVDCTGDAG